MGAGRQLRAGASAIFYATEEQRKAAEAAKDALAKSGKFQKPIATAILPASKFWPAEGYHQKLLPGELDGLRDVSHFRPRLLPAAQLGQ